MSGENILRKGKIKCKSQKGGSLCGCLAVGYNLKRKSLVDVVGVLTEQPTQDGARNYWKVLKTRLKQEGVEGTTICSTLKLLAQDGKMRMTDVASTEQIFRIIQSVPSPKPA
jgi:hypothetical protein